MNAFNDATPIYEEGEYCEVCGATSDLGLFDDMITVCDPCYSGGRLQAHLEVEMEKALSNSPEFERTAEGGYRRTSK